MTYLFDSAGHWIAFQKGIYVFNTDGDWIGWLPWQDGHVVDTDGHYLGTIVQSGPQCHRLYYFEDFQNRGYPGYPGYPGHQEYPGYPGFAGPSPLPPLAQDILTRRIETA